VWRRELIRFEETSLPAAQRSVQLAELRRRSLAVLAGTAARVRASDSVPDAVAALTQLRVEIAAASSADASLPILHSIRSRART
jgi:ABC-type amino acid transport substrate-binding protein